MTKDVSTGTFGKYVFVWSAKWLVPELLPQYFRHKYQICFQWDDLPSPLLLYCLENARHQRIIFNIKTFFEHLHQHHHHVHLILVNRTIMYYWHLILASCSIYRTFSLSCKVIFSVLVLLDSPWFFSIAEFRSVFKTQSNM